MIRFIGPGFILSAAIIGSGELIATTALGARAGFVLLWVILLSCLFKVTIQVEYGRRCIVTGRTTFGTWSSPTGLRLFGVHWSIFAALIFLLSACPGGGGILGGAVQVLAFSFPDLPVVAWVLLVIFSLGLLVSHGSYKPIELVACIFNIVMIATVLYCDLAVLSTSYAFGFGDILSGLEFHLPPERLTLALAVFGITGLGSGEIVIYPYWCLEKGYAAWTGPRDGSDEWVRRARGWIRVMQLDALLSMVAYTLATCGFYLLGAAVLHGQDALADGSDLVFQLSSIFTSVLGDGSRTVFMLCAFVALYSTLFSNMAGFARLWVDLLRCFGLVRLSLSTQKQRFLMLVSWALPIVWGIFYLAIQKPLFLVVLMGLSNAGFLLVVAYQALAYRYENEVPQLTPSVRYDIALWMSVGVTVIVAFWMVVKAIVPQ